MVPQDKKSPSAAAWVSVPSTDACNNVLHSHHHRHQLMFLEWPKELTLVLLRCK